MSVAANYPHLTLENDGTVRIAGLRYTVRILAAEHFHYGWSAEEILRQHPDLRPEEVYAAMTYFYDHAEELIDSIGQIAEETEERRLTQPLTRSELLKRCAAARI